MSRSQISPCPSWKFPRPRGLMAQGASPPRTGAHFLFSGDTTAGTPPRALPGSGSSVVEWPEFRNLTGHHSNLTTSEMNAQTSS